jgi:tRNA 2-selenouridine synthase
MILPIEPPTFLEQSTRFPVIDVRSPGEFLQGHVPGAINLPLFTDEERAVVGTLYVQSGQEHAIQKGLDIALPKVALYLTSLQKISSSGRIMLHCWRGGLRSAKMAEVFSKAGYEVSLLTGGYKAYRRYIRMQFAVPSKIMVLGGFTGSGKTELLHAIGLMGEQIVDLEELACHKGSVFGALGQCDQPTNEQFENNLASRWAQLDLSRLIWIEDESRMIGRITLPDPVVEQINNGTLIRVDLDFAIRIKRLVKEYAGFDKLLLNDAIAKISDRLGGARAKEAMQSLENDCFEEVAAIVLAYYDNAYQFSMTRRKGEKTIRIPVTGENMKTDAAHIIELAY